MMKLNLDSTFWIKASFLSENSIFSSAMLDGRLTLVAGQRRTTICVKMACEHVNYENQID